MSLLKRLLLPILVATALLVESADTLSWWYWQHLVAGLQEQPEAGATRLTSDALVTLPPMVAQSSWLADHDLRAAPPPAVAGVLKRLGRLQHRWFVTDAIGPKNLSRAAILKNDLATAINHLRDALARDPTSPYLHRLAARVLQLVGRRQELLDHLAEAEAIAPGYAQPVVPVSPEEQEWITLEGLKRHVRYYRSNRTINMIRLAKLLQQHGDDAAARQVRAEISDHPLARLEQARQALAEGKAEETITTARQLTGNHRLPASLRSQAWMVLAIAQYESGSRQQALAAASTAAGLSSGSPAPFIALARVAETSGDPTFALAYLRRARGLAPADVGLLVEVARLAEQVGSVDEGAQALRQATEIEPGREDLAIRLVLYYRRNGDAIKAALYLSQLLERFPDSTRLRQLAGEPSPD
jgi:tetratricopeptide (TPR) repeat protein